MIKFLGYENLMPKYQAYNVAVSFPYAASKAESSKGSNVAVVYVSQDVFETYFKDAKIGSDLSINIGFNKRQLNTPMEFKYEPYFKL